MKQHASSFDISHLAFTPSDSYGATIQYYQHNYRMEEIPFYFIRELYFYMVDKMSIAVHALLMGMLIMRSVDEILLPRYIKWPTTFKCLLFKQEKQNLV